MNTISFKAKYLNSYNIQYLNPAGKLKDFQTSLVELNPKDCKDRDAISQVALDWEEKDDFAKKISSHLDDCSYYDTCKRFLALTAQNSEFEHLIPEKVLGIAEIIQNEIDRIRLEYLQVDPNNNMHSKTRKFKGVGTRILDGIKNLYPSKDIVLSSMQSAIEFYKANGFEQYTRKKSSLLFKH